MECHETYLEIKNWNKYQLKMKSGRTRRDWIRIDTNRVDDPDYASLPFFTRGLLDGIMAYSGRSGRWIRNDPKFISRATQTIPKEAHCIPQAILKLTSLGFLTLCNQQNILESPLQDNTIQYKTVKPPKVPRTPNKRPAFVKPDVRDIFKYMQEISMPDPESKCDAFMDYYESNGWRVGKNPMKDWKCTVRTWKRNNYGNGGNGNGKLYGQARSDANRAAFAEALRRAEERDSKEAIRP